MRLEAVISVALATCLTGCVTTTMQGYADRDLPSRSVSHVAALIMAPLPLAQAMQTSLAAEAAKRNLELDDALTLFPPTRTYTDAEIKRDLKTQGVNAVLIVNVGDTGVTQQYAGTVLSGDIAAP